VSAVSRKAKTKNYETNSSSPAYPIRARRRIARRAAIIPRMSEQGDRRGPWQVLGSRQVYENAWIRVREDDVIRPDGQPGIYGVVEFQGLAVAIIALTEDEQVYLVGQYRYPTDTYSWEVVEGTSEAGEEPLAAAKRELSEETGLT